MPLQADLTVPARGCDAGNGKGALSVLPHASCLDRVERKWETRLPVRSGWQPAVVDPESS